MIKSLPFLGRLAAPKASQPSLDHIKQQLRNRNISETDIKLLLKAANIVKLSCYGGLLTEKPYKAVSKETLLNLVNLANKSRGELLSKAGEKSRGALGRYIRNEHQEAGAIGSSLRVIPDTSENPVLPPLNTQKRIPITRRSTTTSEQPPAIKTPTDEEAAKKKPVRKIIPLEVQFTRLFLQLQLKDKRLEQKHLQTLINLGVLHKDNLHGNDDPAIEQLTQEACKALGFDQD
ncbi:hypothetical protein GZ77_01695 [Endozoicomonas montiporae]|uniref:Uncharacterized protein n=1 Tax=Endozoicomonas montiporae TaxID=1027273 RepID=A0A081NAB4_9GAMM|nr:hypothetical protein GZ77_01695 [Endozoicomonas montiporae]